MLSISEKDIISRLKLDNLLKLAWAYEIKWSDRYFKNPQELRALIKFSKGSKLSKVGCSTKTKTGKKLIGNVDITFFPSSLHCYQVGCRVTIGNDY
jgi:uncharacterized protein